MKQALKSIRKLLILPIRACYLLLHVLVSWPLLPFTGFTTGWNVDDFHHNTLHSTFRHHKSYRLGQHQLNLATSWDQGVNTSQYHHSPDLGFWGAELSPRQMVWTNSLEISITIWISLMNIIYGIVAGSLYKQNGKPWQAPETLYHLKMLWTKYLAMVSDPGGQEVFTERKQMGERRYEGA